AKPRPCHGMWRLVFGAAPKAATPGGTVGTPKDGRELNVSGPAFLSTPRGVAVAAGMASARRGWPPPGLPGRGDAPCLASGSDTRCGGTRVSPACHPFFRTHRKEHSYHHREPGSAPDSGEPAGPERALRPVASPVPGAGEAILVRGAAPW